MSGQEIKCPVCKRIPREVAWQTGELWTVALSCSSAGRTTVHHHNVSVSETHGSKAAALEWARAAWVRVFGQKEGGRA